MKQKKKKGINIKKTNFLKTSTRSSKKLFIIIGFLFISLFIIVIFSSQPQRLLGNAAQPVISPIVPTFGTIGDCGFNHDCPSGTEPTGGQQITIRSGKNEVSTTKLNTSSSKASNPCISINSIRSTAITKNSNSSTNQGLVQIILQFFQLLLQLLQQLLGGGNVTNPTPVATQQPTPVVQPSTALTPTAVPCSPTNSPQPTTPINSNSSGTRGWAKIENNTLVSDQGTLLRGATLWFIPYASSEYDWATSTSAWSYFTQYHLNTVRLAVDYGPVTSAVPSTLTMAQVENELDTAIAKATANHMYAVIDLHWDAGAHDQSSAVTFWTTIAARYKNDTNVIYELLNEPVAWSPKNYTAQDLSDEEQQIGRAHV